MHVERVLDVLAVLQRLPHKEVGQEDALENEFKVTVFKYLLTLLDLQKMSL